MAIDYFRFLMIYIFNSLKDAQKRLSLHGRRFNHPYSPKLIHLEDIVRYSVQANIFRVLGMENGRKPSEIYRCWATKNLLRMHRQLRKVRSQQEFDRILIYYTDQLIKQWHEASGAKMCYGPASKMVNLLIKTLQECAAYRIETIVGFQHVPWDSFTLQPLRNIINEVSNVPYAVAIPKNATMSFINTQELYMIMQHAIDNIYEKIGYPAIYYDYYAWNDNH